MTCTLTKMLCKSPYHSSHHSITHIVSSWSWDRPIHNLWAKFLLFYKFSPFPDGTEVTVKSPPDVFPKLFIKNKNRTLLFVSPSGVTHLTRPHQIWDYSHSLSLQILINTVTCLKGYGLCLLLWFFLEWV